MFKTLVSIALTTIAVSPSTAAAHYLWVTVKSQDGTDAVHLYFEEGPGPGDGKYLDPFVKRGKTWLRTAEDLQAQPVKMKEIQEGKNRWLVGTVGSEPPRAIDSYGKWGVYRYGNTDVLLHYYAKHIDAPDAGQFNKLARAERQQLDIVPHRDDGSVRLTVLWEGKPAAGRKIYLRGPKKFRQNVETDENGQVQLKVADAGRYLVRTYYELPEESGEFEGKEYQKVRHNATLVLDLPLSK